MVGAGMRTEFGKPAVVDRSTFHAQWSRLKASQDLSEIGLHFLDYRMVGHGCVDRCA
jgi:hypothetical protein